MGERRVSGWFVLSAVFIVLVFGLFFTFTERKTWPEHRTELGPMDMRMVPPVSTLWCEAVALHSDHSFVAYQINHATRINSNRLSSQEVNLQMKLGRNWNTNSLKLKYFLLPSSVIEIVACSSSPGVKLLIFKGDLDVQRCLQSLVYEESSKSNEFDSDEDTSEEDDYPSSYSEVEALAYKGFCSSMLTYRLLEDSEMDDNSMTCGPYAQLHPIKVNITEADFYVVVVWNTNREVTNHVNLHVVLDRTRYTVHRSGQPFDLCSLSTSCTIGLGFATADRVLVSIPEEPNAGRSSFVVRSRCKPRLAVFAILSVFLPLLLFLVVAFVIRADRDSLGKLCHRTEDSSRRRRSNGHRIIRPLLDDRNASSFDILPEQTTTAEISTVQTDEMPPPYHTLYDPPPPYAVLKESDPKTRQTS